jgi:hypothetical protein
LTVALRDDHGYQSIINRIVGPLFDGWQNWLLADNRWFIFGAASWFLVTIALALTRWMKPAAVLVVSFVFIVAAAREAHRNALAETEGVPRHYYEAQLWSRANTPPGTGFLLTDGLPYGSWRGVSQRPALYPNPTPFPYANFAFAAAHQDRISAFRKAQGDDWNAFGRKFGANYLVENAAAPKRPLREAFRNASFVIYRLD